MEQSYLNGNGKYQESYDSLWGLVPDEGPADTLAGELIRAVSRIAHDLWNNGMGNNTSGAVNFLSTHEAIDDTTYNTIYEFSRGRVYDSGMDGGELEEAVERAIDSTVELIIFNPQLEMTSNAVDFFDCSDSWEELGDDDGDDDY